MVGRGETRVLLIRHGQTDGNRKGHLLGSTDMPLNEVGRAQARLLGRWLATNDRVDAIYSSPLARAHETAAIICAALGREDPHLVEPRLREMDFGEAEGIPVEEIAVRFPHLADFVGTALPDHPDWQWPGGDFRVAFYTGVVETIDGLAARHHGQTVALVTHGGVITGYLHWVTRQVLGYAVDLLVDNCSVTELRWLGDRVTVLRLGDTSARGPEAERPG